MSLESLKNRVKQDKYTKENVAIENGRTYIYNFYKNNFFDITDYPVNNTTCTHAAFERLMNKKINIINFIRDIREDWGDDGGFCFFTGEKDGRFVLGFESISYNAEYSSEFQESDKLESELNDLDEETQLKYFNTFEEMDNYVKELVAKLKKMSEEDLDFFESTYYDNEEAEECGLSLSEEEWKDSFMCNCLKNMGMAFYEYPEENLELLEKLTQKDSYQKNFIDPIEFIDSWIEKEGIKSI